MLMKWKQNTFVFHLFFVSLFFWKLQVTSSPWNYYPILLKNRLQMRLKQFDITHETNGKYIVFSYFCFRKFGRSEDKVIRKWWIKATCYKRILCKIIVTYQVVCISHGLIMPAYQLTLSLWLTIPLRSPWAFAPQCFD